jgi:hypothetical protein
MTIRRFQTAENSRQIPERSECSNQRISYHICKYRHPNPKSWTANLYSASQLRLLRSPNMMYCPVIVLDVYLASLDPGQNVETQNTRGFGTGLQDHSTRRSPCRIQIGRYRSQHGDEVEEMNSEYENRLKVPCFVLNPIRLPNIPHDLSGQNSDGWPTLQSRFQRLKAPGIVHLRRSASHMAIRQTYDGQDLGGAGLD